MAATHHQQQASSSGSSYDVFMSFHGGDVRRSFADHLYHTLRDAGIRTFRDDEELKKGEKIAPELQAAIQQSTISIPIFSMNYGSSKWCLNELNEIYECKRTGKQIVFPIFYKIEPRDVRHQTASYAEAFDKEHPGRFDPTLVQKWRQVLKEIGDLKGWHFKEETYEGELLRKVIKEVLSTLNKRPRLVLDELVGIESHTKKMLELLDIERKVTKIIGIYGLGGIGKTTIARAVCNEVLSRFDQHALVENVREDARNGICYLQNKIITAVLKDKCPKIVDVDDGIKVIRQMLHEKRVLVVLDDVDQDEQAKSLIGDGEWFGIGSRIIITSRNKDILNARKAHEIYEPKSMDSDDSLELFSHHAFKRNQPQEDYLAISKAIVKTTGGLPLALKVIGSSLFEKKMPFWKGKLKMLQEVPDDNVMKRLQISYDDLGYREQQMFLDTACFFIGMKKDIVYHIWEGCNLYPEVGLDILCAKSLITINKDGELRMHDVLRDLGRHIVHQESEKPEKRSRIWSEEEVLNVLVKRKGKIKCSGLTIDFKKSNIDSKRRSRGGCLMSSRLKEMTRPRLLKLDYAQLLDNCVNSFSELIWLSWKGCPEHYALTNFYPEKLVVLDLSDSEITENWMGWEHIKVAANLKVLKLESCKKLCNTPDLSGNPLLEVLSFNDCGSLLGIHSSIGSLKSLVTLDLRLCKSLVGLPIEIHSLTSLVTLELMECTSLGCLPTEIGFLVSLVTLNLRKCNRLVSLPIEIGSLTSLVTLDLRDCRSLVCLPTEIGFLTSLITLDLSHCQVCIPTEIGLLTSLVTLDLSHCSYLGGLPTKIGSLTSLVTLDLSHCSGLRDLPTVIGFLTSLVTLNLRECDGLVGLPPEIGFLTSLVTLDLRGCKHLVGLPANIGFLTSLTKLELTYCYSFKDISSLPPSLTSIRFSHCNSLQSIPSLPSGLTSINIYGCSSLPSIPSLPSGLTSVHVSYCDLVRSILLPSSLTSLSVRNCSSLVELAASGSGSGLRNLKTLQVYHCASLEEIEGVDEKLESLEECEILSCNSLKLLPKLRCSKNLRNLWLVNLCVMSHFEGEGMDSLEKLYIDKCSSLKKIPYLRDSKGFRELFIGSCPELTEIECLEGYASLQKLSIRYIEALTKLSDDISTLKNLRELEIYECEKLSRIPGLFGLESLQKVKLEGCHNLAKLDSFDGMEALCSLEIIRCCSLERLPDISNLKKLRTLQISECQKLPNIPSLDRLEALGSLTIDGCSYSMERLLDLSNLKGLKKLEIQNCQKLSRILGLDGLEYLEVLEISLCNNLSDIHGVDRLKSLQTLYISTCCSLERIPDLSNLKKLRKLHIESCQKLPEIPGLDGLESLQVLTIIQCDNVSKIHGIDRLKSLHTLEITRCCTLERLPNLSNLKEFRATN